MGTAGSGNGGGYEPPAVSSSVSTWLSSTISTVTSNCYTWFKTQKTKPTNWETNLIDECVVGYFTGMSTFNLNYPDASPKLTPLGGSWSTHCFAGGCTANSFGSIVFDADRNPVPYPASGEKICDAGSYGWLGSPISLIWDENFDLDSEINITQFPLDPTTKNKWHLWKASGKAPLLVYDPEHRGEIKTGEQLFGNWTFGGKRLASLTSKPTQTVSKWKDGFEALASLDNNGDNKITDLELEPLGLWFDYNKNGISDRNEVKSLKEVNVKTLYFSPDRYEAQTRNLIATIGYERIENDTLIRGAAIDWHSDSAETKEQLVNMHLAHASLCNTPESSLFYLDENSDSSSASALSSDMTANTEIAKKIAGIWLWVSDDTQFTKPELLPKGYLGFGVNDDLTLKGHSFSEIKFPQHWKEAKYLLMINPLNGKIVNTANLGHAEIEFTVQATGNTAIKSRAVLSKDGTELIGHSRATVIYQNKPVTVFYTWKAVREQLATGKL